MSRMPPAQRLQSLRLAVLSHCSSNSSSAATRSRPAITRALSTSTPVQSKNTEWIRGKLWKGDAPGPADPYTQRPEPQAVSNLPDEAYNVERSSTRSISGSGLALPPRRSEAPTEKEIKASDSAYVEAEDASELETLETLESWWDQPGHWSASSEFRGFGSPVKVEDRALAEVCARRAVVEILSLRENRSFRKWAYRKWQAGGRADFDRTLAVEIDFEGSQPTVDGESAAAVRGALKADVALEEEYFDMSTDEAQQLVKSWDSRWKDITLNEAEIFALRKRLCQLTGTRIADAKIVNASQVKHMLALALKPEKARKLHDVLEQGDILPLLPNVKLHSRRVGAIDKEIAVGRWKVIEEELRKRDLPVLGSEIPPSSKEKDWLLEKA